MRLVVGVFLVVVGLVAAQNAYVLNRFERNFREEIDDKLDEELEEVRAAAESGDLKEWVDRASAASRKDEDLSIEVLDGTGAVIARSQHIPGCGEDVPDEISKGHGLRYWERPHPGSRSGAKHIRVAEHRTGSRTICVALSMEQVQRWYWNLRRNLAVTLVLIALLGALAAWWVAARALRPIAEIAARARSLGALPDGSLPRTGSGDEVDRLAAVLNDLLHRIRREVLHVRRITADVAHALRTPLTAIRGNLELQIGRADDAHADVLESSLEQVDELVRLVNQLLLLEKLEGGSPDGRERERVDVLALARGLVDHQRVIADERGVALRLHGDAVVVQADPGQLRQAIANLVDNALRHTPAGGTVEVEVSTKEGNASVSVADTGCGITPGDLERVFERFYSTAEDLSRGTGLGLPIARAIARAHGGDVTASSPDGAVFTLTLPVAEGGAP
jgi:two-component system heavy metal sensor histidine kinase CusS